MDEREREYIEAWRERLARQEKEKHVRARRLRETARSCARRLVHDYGASRVYLFGSLLEGAAPHARSDIDLAVEGLAGNLYFKALGDVWRLLPAGVELDLVRLEQAWPDLAERIKAEGELLDVAA